MCYNHVMLSVLFAPDLSVRELGHEVMGPIKAGFEDVARLADIPININEVDNSISDRIFVAGYDESREQVSTRRALGAVSVYKGTALVYVTMFDLFAEGTNFIFGQNSATEIGGYLALSPFRFSADNAGNIGPVMKHIARHEAGHMFGLREDSDYPNPDRRGGLYEGHCANEPCTMQQKVTVPDMLRQMEKLQHRPHAGFCADCVATLHKK